MRARLARPFLTLSTGWKKAKLSTLEPYLIPTMHIYPFLAGFVPAIAGSVNGPIAVYCQVGYHSCTSLPPSLPPSIFNKSSELSTAPGRPTTHTGAQ